MTLHVYILNIQTFPENVPPSISSPCALGFFS
jgi:hypothetical protein